MDSPTPPAAGRFRIAARLTRAALLLGAVVPVLAAWRCAKPGSATARRLERLIWTLLLRSVAIDLRCFGTPLAAPGTLHVANHVSWTDIAALGFVLDAGFVAKQDVAAWPVIGKAARRYGCLFVSREPSAAVAAQARAVGQQLGGPRGLILFAEATTGLGDRALPFRSSLFPESGAPVQPITLVYRERDGTPLDAKARRQVAWIDDDELLPHFWQLAKRGGVRLDIHFEVAVSAPGRKQIAAACHTAIAARLARQAATENRAA